VPRLDEVTRAADAAATALKARKKERKAARRRAKELHRQTQDARGLADSTKRALAGEVDEAPDLVALGTRGLGGLRRLVLGSTASAVVHHAPCSGGVGSLTPGQLRLTRGAFDRAQDPVPCQYADAGSARAATGVYRPLG